MRRERGQVPFLLPSDNTTATVASDASNSGNAYGVAAGVATISACVGGAANPTCGTATLTVGAPTPPPQLDGLAPGSGMVGSWVAISGSSFGSSQGSSAVSFGGVLASTPAPFWSDTAIMVVVPSGLGVGATVPVTVTTSAGTSNSEDFIPVSTSPAYNVSPQQINLLVGQTRTITVRKGSGTFSLTLVSSGTMGNGGKRCQVPFSFNRSP